MAGRFSSAPPTMRPTKAPASDSGRAPRIVTGLKKLRNSSTSTPNTMPMPASIAAPKLPNSSAKFSAWPAAHGRATQWGSGANLACASPGVISVSFPAWSSCRPYLG